MRIPVLRGVFPLLAVALCIVSLVDGGSVALARMSLTDQARGAGHAATAAVADQPANRQTVRVAFEAARAEARTRNISVRTTSFTLYPDGRVT